MEHNDSTDIYRYSPDYYSYVFQGGKLGTRFILFLIFFSAISGYACMNCHEPHYANKGDCSLCHRGNMESSRKNIAHFGIITAKYSGLYTDENDVKTGKEIVEDSACRRCHIIGAKGENSAVSLDYRAKIHTGEYLADKLINTNEYMPDFHFSDRDVTKIIKYLLFASSGTVQKEAEPYVAYIKTSDDDVFGKHCGNCHKVITRQSGGKGTGEIARNLSGLFSQYFDSDVLQEGDDRWTPELLLKWVRNPRSINKTTIMPPVNLSKNEESDLSKLFENK
ncbi:selenite/tellurite reduction operon c-type cytochrome lipoprotein ExtS [Denitrovibrio acetiphilus]|nr:selenite/tellurite reduction operon c-type cytochrome lipoprotein ExtS [Denitrovibrio acetiphilus]